MTAIKLATQIIAVEEGYESHVYLDTLGYPTIGYGLKIGGRDMAFDAFSQFPSMPESVAYIWLQTIIEDIESDLEGYCWFNELTDLRQAVIMSMAYQLGMNGLLLFTQTISHIRDMDYAEAAQEMLYSKWAQQTPGRAIRHATMMEDDALEEYYLVNGFSLEVH